MNKSTIAIRYARALLDFATKRSKEDQVYNDSITLCKGYENHPNLERVLSNLLLSKEKKVEIISQLCGENVSPEFLQFIKVVVEQRREEFLLMMCLDYQQLMYDHKNLVHVKLATVVSIDEATQAKIRTSLNKLTGKNIILQPVIDSSIIGGYVLHWDTYRYDASIKSMLKRLEKSLTI